MEEFAPSFVPSNVLISSSFCEAVANSNQWFSEAKKIMLNSLKWEDSFPLPSESPNVINFSKEDLESLRKPWQLTLMGKCLGINIRSSFMIQRIKAMWRPKGHIETIDIGRIVFLFCFSKLDDLETTLFGGPWFILDHELMLTTCKPNFRPSMNLFSKLIVWNRFPELPVEYFNKEALFNIAKVVGKPIRVNYVTNSVSKGQYARVCVEINLCEKLTTSVWVGSEWQQTQYENLHYLCFSCGKIAHLSDTCSMSPLMQPKCLLLNPRLRRPPHLLHMWRLFQKLLLLVWAHLLSLLQKIPMGLGLLLIIKNQVGGPMNLHEVVQLLKSTPLLTLKNNPPNILYWLSQKVFPLLLLFSKMSVRIPRILPPKLLIIFLS